jgi:hypothetical protein
MIKLNELKQLASAATRTEWHRDIAKFRTAANPETVIKLCDEIEKLRELENACKELSYVVARSGKLEKTPYQCPIEMILKALADSELRIG